MPLRNTLPIVATVLALSLPALAIMVEYPVDRMVAESGAIVRGRVESLGARWLEGPGSIIVTDMKLTVDEVWMGGYRASQTIEFYVVGGVVDGLGMKQEHQPEFRRGEDVVLFLWTQPDESRTAIFNDEQGKYRVVGETVLNFHGEPIELDEFRTNVDRAIQIHGRR